MATMELFANPMFWAMVIAVASFLVVLYFILRQSIADGIRQAHEQERLEEEERRNKGYRR